MVTLEETLNKMNIHQLRTFAAELGQKLTMYPKKEMISRLLLMKDCSNFLDVLKYVSENSKNCAYPYLKQFAPVEEVKIEDIPPFPVEGVYHFVDGKNYLFDLYLAHKLKVIIPQTIVENDKLKEGMKIKGSAKKLKSDEPAKLVEIIEVDNGKKEKVDLSKFNGRSSLGSNFVLRKCKFDIARGQKVYIKNFSKENVVALSETIVNNNYGVYVKVLNINCYMDNTHNFEIRKIKDVNYNYGIPADDFVGSIDAVFAEARREIELGRPQVVIINRFYELIRKINNIYSGTCNYKDFNSNALYKIQEILMRAFNYDDKINLTIICCDEEGALNPFEEITQYEIMPIFDKII